MTQLLEKAMAEVSRLPEAEQDIMASLILDELAFENKWEQSFAKSSDVLAKLALEALAEHRAGKTQVLRLEDL